ncbi:hypothetical protein [Kitasatospora sp. NPDC057223]|uniref:hypothetical protein n=1 Tax=Kitasatospora sp. NPDC057223 TaxID=3346055 RepID=UPI0036455B87
MASAGRATDWCLEIPGRPPLVIRDTAWTFDDERDVVLRRTEMLPEMPARLTQLFNRERAGIHHVNVDRRRILAYLAVPEDGRERPRRRRSLTVQDLVVACNPAWFAQLLGNPGVSLASPLDPASGEPGRGQHEIHFDADDSFTPVYAYVLTRLVPTLRKIGWLAGF